MITQTYHTPRPSLLSPWNFDSDWDYYDSIEPEKGEEEMDFDEPETETGEYWH